MNEGPIRMCGLGGLAGGAASAPSDMVMVPREVLKQLLSRKYDFHPSLKDTLRRLKPGGLTGHDWTDRDSFDQVIRLLDFLSELIATAPASAPNT